MKKQITFTRWHRYDMNGVKHIRRFELGIMPATLPDEGYTEWIRGTGDFSDEALNNLRVGIQRACKGVPKPDSQKQKMRDAKLGVPKSEEHKQSMRDSWHRRKQKELNAQETNTETNTSTV
jgi:hypothetical protein